MKRKHRRGRLLKDRYCRSLLLYTIPAVFAIMGISLGSCSQTNDANIPDKKSAIMEMTTNEHTYGIIGQKAPELEPFSWIDADGKERAAIQLADDKGKFVVLYCFQSWCPGCHSIGLPSLQKMTKALQGNDHVKFYAIQTVFEGKTRNTFEKLKETQQQYNLAIPFGHDEGTSATRNISSTMYNYRTGGTPWFIFIDQQGVVVFNDFHLDTEKAIQYLKTIQ